MNFQKSQQMLDSGNAFGPRFNPDGTATFRVWAPRCQHLSLVWCGAESQQGQPLQRSRGGWFERTQPATAGQRYWFRVPDGRLLPDPASQFQPLGVHGPSQLVDPHHYVWHDASYRGVAKSDLVIYELHVGTFTQAGTYQAASERLPELAALGITAVELLPVAATAGQRNWGYDGVQWFAPQHSYGTPDDLRRLVDAAHALGIAVIMDVVYNHLGPEGNYLAAFGPYASAKHRTPWGDAPNVDAASAMVRTAVRGWIIANALYWIEAFHCDGLRLDALHCMRDDSSPHIVTEIGQHFAALRSKVNRPLHLIAESNVYDPEILQPASQGGAGFDAMWCDDFLHSVNAVLRPGQDMAHRPYYPDRDLDTTLRQGYVYTQTLRGERCRVEPSESVAAAEFGSLIFSIQNHDFVGNHPAGLRMHELTSVDAQRAAAALLLLTPAVPMLFMGEEFHCSSPFHFFVDFQDQHLRRAVVRGRRGEYPQHDWRGAPSPLDTEVFTASKLPAAVQDGQQAEGYQWYTELLRLRRQMRALGLLTDDSLRQASFDPQRQLACLAYRSPERKATVYVRLHPPEDLPSPIQVQVAGQVCLQQHASGFEHDGQLVTLRQYGVLVLLA